MTNRESRPHLVKAYKDLVLPAFNQHVYTDTDEKYEFRALRWVMKREVNLRGFLIEVNSLYYGLNRKSGPVLVALIYNDNMDIASYYLARGKLEGLDKGDSFGWTALIHASFFGYLDIVEELLATGADKDKAHNSGDIPLTVAAGRGHIEVLKALLAAVADKTKANESGEIALSLATDNGHIRSWPCSKGQQTGR